MATSKVSDLPVVLLVEDNDDLRLFLERQLMEFYKVELARNGAEGFQKAIDIIPDLYR
jgi:DNA-binding response OmpR family regulator